MIFLLIIVFSLISLNQSNFVIKNEEKSPFLSELAVIFCNFNVKTIHIYYHIDIITDIDRLIKDLEIECNDPVALVMIR